MLQTFLQLAISFLIYYNFYTQEFFSLYNQAIQLLYFLIFSQAFWNVTYLRQRHMKALTANELELWALNEADTMFPPHCWNHWAGVGSGRKDLHSSQQEKAHLKLEE